MEVILLIVHNHILEKKLIKNILTNKIIIHNLNNNLVILMEVIVQLYHLYLQLLYNMLDIINTVNIRIWEVIYILVIIVVVQILIH